MPTSILSSEAKEIIEKSKKKRTKQIIINGEIKTIPSPFPSPKDWRDHWIYFLMVDRFCGTMPPQEVWNKKTVIFQGGNFNGIRTKLDYLNSLGVGAIWLSPVFKNCQFIKDETYHGYGIQNFLHVEPRFGTEEELQNLIDEAHARGIYVIFDIVINHTGDIFNYMINGMCQSEAEWSNTEYTIRWRDEDGICRIDWEEAPEDCHPNAAVWPSELRHNEYFRRKGKGEEIQGDFSKLKELATDYRDSNAEGEPDYFPVRDLLIKAYQYIIAKYDIDGFRIDTLKHVEPEFARIFGNAIREFALSIGKTNFFIFGEVADEDENIAKFIGRFSTDPDDILGADAALDFPLFHKLPKVLKGIDKPGDMINQLEARKKVYKNHLSSHGEATKFFVTFLDNHDQHQRFFYQAPEDPHKYDDQVTMGLGCLYALQGIPCLYYGTEQGLHGFGNAFEDVREALWGKPEAFDTNHLFYREINSISKIRDNQPALRYGRQYFREISGDGAHFDISFTSPGVLAFSRILDDEEILVVANTNTLKSWVGYVLIDYSINNIGQDWEILYSNKAHNAERPEQSTVKPKGSVSINRVNGTHTNGPVRILPVSLKPMEIQMLKKVRV